MKLLPVPLLLVLLGACSSDEPATADDSVGAFVTVLGDDTLAVERFERTPLTMTTDVVLRSPRITVRHYEIEVDGFENLERYEEIVRVPEAAAETPPLRRLTVEPVGDSLRMTVTERGMSRTSMIPASDDVLPFIDMVHWPFEIMLRRAFAAGEDSVAQELFTGQGTMSFVITRIGPELMSVRHPFRGTMLAQIDSAGRLQELDARETTRKMVVRRVPDVEIEPLVNRWAALDAAGRSFGELSGRGQAAANVDGASITIDYGRPEVRGRVIFGHVVPFGEVWRTGANRATHLVTDRRLSFEELEVPAGEYTLFTIPRADGATLIVNRQTGQGGTSYDPEHDLGRVQMERATLPEPVEVFTIRVDDTESGGNLAFQWDRTAYAARFVVQ